MTSQGKPRKAITPAMKVKRLLDMAWKIGAAHTGTDFQRAPVCRICGDHLAVDDEIDWDHIQPLAQNGAHAWWNIVPVHRACHKVKTFGNKATTANSDIGKISKERRILRTGKFIVDRSNYIEAMKTPKPKRPWPSRKMQGRKFGKRVKP